MKISLIVGLLGAVILAYSFSLEPYTDINKFFSSINTDDQNSEEYYTMRESFLTPKYRIQDTGITLVLLSLIALVSIKYSKEKIVSPSKEKSVIILAVVLPIITTGSILFDLVQGQLRNEFPPWADSIGISIMSLPFELGLLLAWSLVHLLFTKGYESLPISSSFTIKLNPWLLILSVVTLLITLTCIFWGQYWYVLPGILWLYYYLSIGASRLNYCKNNKG